MLPLRSPREIEAIAAAGRILDTIIADLARHECRPGLTTRELADRADALIRARRGEPILRGYIHASAPNPYPASACICVNEEVVHAVPSTRILREGDIVTIDVAMRHKGWCIDNAWSLPVLGPSGPNSPALARAKRLQSAAAGVLQHALSRIAPGIRWSAIARECAAVASHAGMHLVSGYCGHGIGRQLHESPRVAFTSTDWSRSGEDFTLWPGMVLCLEPIVGEGLEPAPLVTLDDGWTVLTANRAWTAHEECCIAVTLDGCRVLAGQAD